MASAGQAQAHSSHPMHFSSPSGQRLSWWCPWNRGAVGRLSSGYITASTFRNISRKVTPNPFTGLRKSSTGDLLSHTVVIGVRRTGQRGVAELKAVVMRQVERWHRVPRLGRGGLGHLDQLALIVVVPLVFLLLGGTRLARPQPLEPLGVAVVPERDQRDEEHEDDAGDRVDDRRVVVLAQRPHRGHQQQPDDRERDQD